MLHLFAIPSLPVTMYAVHLQQVAVGQGGARLGTAIVVIGGTAVFVVLMLKALRHAAALRVLRLGFAGEVAVGQALNELLRVGYWVFHDFPANGFNIDHIAVGPAGVFAVETKARRKPTSEGGKKDATVVYDGKALYFPDRPQRAHGDSLHQASEQAAWLHRWLSSAVGESVPVHPVLALPGWFVERTAKPGVLVVNPGEFLRLVKGVRDTPLSASVIQRIVHQLDRECRDVDLRPKLEQQHRAKSLDFMARNRERGSGASARELPMSQVQAK